MCKFVLGFFAFLGFLAILAWIVEWGGAVAGGLVLAGLALIALARVFYAFRRPRNGTG
jgi:hypothetical protein